ncbi:unnamed protein product [Hymenolepis diminuta]|uniref:Uncharacterized protein n=1 Tax=Hymenolepis diminuta TaxID=6216 RepID=A0A564Z361_HYMDI|nr:unnamed protein product [Hymenolepis diminuta]
MKEATDVMAKISRRPYCPAVKFPWGLNVPFMGYLQPGWHFLASSPYILW